MSEFGVITAALAIIAISFFAEQLIGARPSCYPENSAVFGSY